MLKSWKVCMGILNLRLWCPCGLFQTKSSTKIGSLLPWWHGFISRKHREIRRHRKGTHLVHTGLGGALRHETGYSGSRVPSTVKWTFPFAGSPGLCLLAFSTLSLTAFIPATFAPQVICLCPSCFYFLCAYCFLSAFIVYAALLAVLPSLCFKFQHPTRRLDGVSSFLSRKEFIY